jgi:hypothetical protein
MQSKSGFTPSLWEGAPTTFWKLGSNAEKLLLGEGLNFNPLKWLEDGVRRLCGGMRRKREKKKKKMNTKTEFLNCLPKFASAVIKHDRPLLPLYSITIFDFH